MQAVSDRLSRWPAFVAAAKPLVQPCTQDFCTEAPWLAGPIALQEDAAVAISP